MQQVKQRMTKERKAAAPRRSAPSTVTGNAVALSISAMMLASTSAAQEAADEEQVELDTVRSQDRTIDTNPYTEPGVPYKARISGDPRRLKEIADTPTTMSVLTQTQIEDSGKSDLREVLAAQPGITLGTGEGGNAFGDRYIIRGHEARSDVFVDGLRDPGMTIRESFALEQVEITKGPSSTFAGRGSTGGAINGITKQASNEYDFVKFQGGPGTDEYYRVHLDVNKRLGDALAVRGNLLYADEEVPDRAPAERLRRGPVRHVQSRGQQAVPVLRLLFSRRQGRPGPRHPDRALRGSHRRRAGLICRRAATSSNPRSTRSRFAAATSSATGSGWRAPRATGLRTTATS